MEVTVYDWEKLYRSKSWYIIFVSFMIFFIILSFVFWNISWVILSFLLLGGYIMFALPSMKKIKASITSEWLNLWPKLYPWWDIHWFALELDEDNKTIKNIVFLVRNNKLIHTFDDDKDNIKKFVMNLSDYAEMLSDYPQSFMEKLIRTLKL